MEVPFNNISPHLLLDEDFIRTAMDETFESRDFILGSKVKEFETAFARTVGLDSYGIGVGNCTDALEIALRGCGVKAGHGVMTQANSAAATVSAILTIGANPIFVDVEIDGLLDPNKIVSDDRLDDCYAIMPVHLYGQRFQTNFLRQLVGYNKIIIEDSAQAAGTSKELSLSSDAACFSFYPTKPLGALGDGGMIVTSSEFCAERFRRLRDYGLNDSYEQIYPFGRNSRLDEIQAAILLKRMSNTQEATNQRFKIAEKYHNVLKEELLHRILDQSCNYHLFTVVVDNRSRVIRELKEMGICTKVHYPTMASRQSYSFSAKRLPMTGWLTERVLSIPCWYGMTEDEVQYVAESLNKVASCNRVLPCLK